VSVLVVAAALMVLAGAADGHHDVEMTELDRVEQVAFAPALTRPVLPSRNDLRGEVEARFYAAFGLFWSSPSYDGMAAS
jgi:hypothetical protein